ncbi:MAG: hypothetical protein QGG05_20925, partial [Candidatus Latescibacteria bacterium]|nr:hypothetical protein [Candidatus Latescibacterota bacterium]
MRSNREDRRRLIGDGGDETVFDRSIIVALDADDLAPRRINDDGLLLPQCHLAGFWPCADVNV